MVGWRSSIEVNLVEPKTAPDAAREVAAAAADEVDPHREARALYRRYLEQEANLEPFRRYADEVALATAGGGMTPVRPLATMGTGGGPLLCDFCNKPIPLEGGRFHGKTADVAWAENPDPDWTSWILGGLIVEIATNHTLRIYHGYPAQQQACYGKATAAEAIARQEFDGSGWSRNEGIVAAFVQDELSSGLDARQQRALVDRILDVLFNYDQGVGVNQP